MHGDVLYCFNIINLLNKPFCDFKICFSGPGRSLQRHTCCLLTAGEMHASNILTDAGFEAGKPFAGWTAYGNSIGNVSVQSGASRSWWCSIGLKTYGQFITAQNYSGVYQDNLSAPSNTYAWPMAGLIQLPVMAAASTGMTRSGLK